jgi:hypothetical protein
MPAGYSTATQAKRRLVPGGGKSLYMMGQACA